MTLSFSYFPGCSQVGTAEEYGDSARAVCGALGIDLFELADWNCCGASSAHMTDDFLAAALPGRNLGIAREMGLDILTVCAACYSRLCIAQRMINEDERLAGLIERATGLDPRFPGKVRHLLDVVANDVGKKAVKGAVRREFDGLKAVAYYGCLLVRPPEVCFCDSVEHPTDLDRLLECLGVEAKRWSFKTDCCGGSLSLSRPDIVERLVNRIFEEARSAGAECIVTACPMCMANLEMRQRRGKFLFRLVHDIPVVYFTELLGIALDIPGSDEWLEKHLITARGIASRAKTRAL